MISDSFFSPQSLALRYLLALRPCLATQHIAVFLLIAMASSIAVAAEPLPVEKEKTTLGWLQSIRLQPYKSRLTAKLDTGAKSSVIHALNIQPFRLNGKNHVRFTVPVTDKKSGTIEEIMFELPVVRQLKVKQHDGKDAEKRPVVRLDFCLNKRVYSADFSLDNRQRFNYPILLGRRFLTGKFVVDPEQKFLYRPDCP